MIFGMTTPAKQTVATIIPSARYRDALAAIDWLVRVLGFERKAVFEGANGTVMHAELTFGNGMFMIGSDSNDGPFAGLITQPDQIGLRETQHAYLVVANAEALYHHVVAEGATIVQELETMPYGGKAFSCRDPEGHAWSIGEFDPWVPES
jgi:uncharacterized glyoxalase superfamily protein PhnB